MPSYGAQQVGKVQINDKKRNKIKPLKKKRERTLSEDKPRAKMGKNLPHLNFTPLVRGVKK